MVSSNRAETATALAKVTTHAFVPLQPPPTHPMKVEPGDALAVSVTGVSAGNTDEQVAPQLIPAGLLLTVPPPVPTRLTVSVGFAVLVNVQVIVRAPCTPLSGVDIVTLLTPLVTAYQLLLKASMHVNEVV